MIRPNDPMKAIIYDALLAAGVNFMMDVSTASRVIDFYLPTEDVYIEVKRMFSDRTEAQMSTCEHIIVVQGLEAVHILAQWIRASFPYNQPF